MAYTSTVVFCKLRYGFRHNEHCLSLYMGRQVQGETYSTKNRKNRHEASKNWMNRYEAVYILVKKCEYFKKYKNAKKKSKVLLTEIEI